MLNLYCTSIHPPRPTHNHHLDTGVEGVAGGGHVGVHDDDYFLLF